MSFNPELEDEGYDINARNVAAAAEGLEKLSSSQNVSDKPLGNKSNFMSMLSKGFRTLVDKSIYGQASKLLNKIAPSTESNMTNKEIWMARGAQGFFRNEDGTWNVSNPFKIDPNTGLEATRKHKMVNIFGEDYPMGPSVKIDDTTPFMLQYYTRGDGAEINQRQEFYNLYLQYKDINPELAAEYLNKYRNYG